MRKRHIAEFQKSELANSGRAAGMGINEDRYGDEDGLGHAYNKRSPFEHNRKGRNSENGEVVIVKKESEI
jgi:hypothetical protein